MTGPVPPAGLRRHQRREPFVQVPSSTIRDRRLSYKARGILTNLLDRPDGWDVRSEVLAAESDQDGVFTVRSGLHEMGAAGYYRLERRRSRPGGTFTMGTAISETPVPEWAAEYAEFDGKAVPVMLQPDGTYKVIRKPDTPPTGEDSPPSSAAPGAGNLTPETGAAPESGFPTPGAPRPGGPEAGKPAPFIRKNTQTETQTAVGASAPPAASPGSDPRPESVPGGLVPLGSSSKDLGKPTPRRAPGPEEQLAAQLLAELPDWWQPKLNAGTRKRLAAAMARRLRGGWMAADLMTEMQDGITPGHKSPAGLLITRLADLDEHPPLRLPGAALMTWCGQCRGPEIKDRWRDTPDGRTFKCPECHPGAAATNRPPMRSNQWTPTPTTTAPEVS